MNGNTQMHIRRVTASSDAPWTTPIWLRPFDPPTFLFGSLGVDAPGPDLALGEALLHFTEFDQPTVVVRHGYAAPIAGGDDHAFMFGAHPEQHVLPPLGELAMFLRDAELD